MLLDIHSHILPAVDDGAKDIEDSIMLLEMMRSQGITHVIATPHFYPNNDTLEDFKSRVADAQLLLNKKKITTPEIVIGCELFYFTGISQSDLINEFTIANSKYILLEPSPFLINKTLMSEILYLKNELGLVPIIPHIERYHKSIGFKDFLKFVKQNNILCQVNAGSFFDKHYNRILNKLFKLGVITFVATDTHSLERPPLLANALNEIEIRFSKDEKQRILTNLEALLSEITAKEQNDEIKHFEYK
ncbi:MAG: hypothetical protein IJA44_05435 [Clostridia bacterium]|nr:hypothetical protein [Clostridia bacterium]